MLYDSAIDANFISRGAWGGVGRASLGSLGIVGLQPIVTENGPAVAITGTMPATPNTLDPNSWNETEAQLVTLVNQYGAGLVAAVATRNWVNVVAYATRYGLGPLLATKQGIQMLGAAPFSAADIRNFYSAMLPYFSGLGPGYYFGHNPYGSTLWGDAGNVMSDANTNANCGPQMDPRTGHTYASGGYNIFPDIAWFAGKQPDPSFAHRWGPAIIAAVAIIVTAGAAAGAVVAIGAAEAAGTAATIATAVGATAGAVSGAVSAGIAVSRAGSGMKATPYVPIAVAAASGKAVAPTGIAVIDNQTAPITPSYTPGGSPVPLVSAGVNPGTPVPVGGAPGVVPGLIGAGTPGVMVGQTFVSMPVLIILGIAAVMIARR